MSKTILEEALADAKQLKAMAIEQAKLQLSAQMTPIMEAALSAQLKEDLNEEETEETEGDEAEKPGDVMEAISKLGLDETTLAAISKAIGEAKGEEAPAEKEIEDDEVEAGEGEGEGDEEVEESFDLDAALAEIEANDEKEEELQEETEEDEAEVEESLDIDAILAEYDSDDEVPAEEEEDEDETTKAPVDEVALFEKFKAYMKGDEKEPVTEAKKADEKVKDEASLKEAAVIQSLKKELKDMNLFAAKLLYQNKVFASTSLTEAQKAKAITAFDKAKTVDATKAIYETLSTASKAKPVNKLSIQESLGFRVLDKKQPLVENKQSGITTYTDEQKIMMKRAGIKF